MKAMVLVLALQIFLSFFILGCSETPRQEFLPEDVQHSIPLDEIFDGGPGKDGIPALTNPRVVSVQTGNQYRISNTASSRSRYSSTLLRAPP